MEEDECIVISDDKETDNVSDNRTRGGESGPSATQKFELSSLLKSKLLEMPEVLEFVVRLQTCVKRQHRKIKKLKQKLKKSTKDESTQTTLGDVTSPQTISEEITEAAELAVRNTGFVYEETSGLYYDYKSGYYYNAEYGLYYDGNTGTYFSYNTEKQTYDFHSRVEVLKEKPARQKRKKGQGKQQEGKPTKRKTECEVIDLEEGECSDNSSGRLKCYKSGSSDDDCDESSDVSKHWPPCMRIIIEETTVPTLKVGSLYIVTYKGATIGREGEHDILIRDINVSKHHLKFLFDSDAGKYLAVDLGSRNGTLLNGKRMAASKQESEALEVVHGSRIQIGASVLLCHVHAGIQTCGLCEPGLVQDAHDKKDVVAMPPRSKVQQHKAQLKSLRKKFGLVQNDNSGCNLAAGYTDRAAVRRETIGSHDEHEKTQVATMDNSISSENKGFKLLAKMGWSEGQSLGKDGTGLLEPIKPVSHSGKAGIGSDDIPVTAGVTKRGTLKKEIWKKTQQRYEQAKLAGEDIFPDLD